MGNSQSLEQKCNVVSMCDINREDGLPTFLTQKVLIGDVVFCNPLDDIGKEIDPWATYEKLSNLCV